MHHIRIFVDAGAFTYIHHNTIDPSNDEPGKSVELTSGEKVQFKSRDGNLTITFKTSSPFVSGNMTLTAPRNKLTPVETTKNIGPIRTAFAYTADVDGDSDDPDIIIDDGGGGSGKKKTPAKKKPKGKKKAKKVAKRKK